MRTALQTISILALFAAAGCGGTDELEHAANAKRAERDRLQKVARNIDDYKAQLARAEAEEKRMKVWRADGDAGTALKTVGEASESPVGFRKIAAGRSHFTLGGRGGAAGMARALQRLAGVAPGMLFVSASVDAAGAWTIEVENRDPWAPPMNLTNVGRNVPVPKKQALEGSKAKALRAEIAKLDAEIAELTKMTGEVGNLEERLVIVEFERARAIAPDSVGGAAPWIAQVFGPILSSGTATASGTSLKASGTLARGVDAASLGAMARGKFEILSVSPPRAEIARLSSR